MVGQIDRLKESSIGRWFTQREVGEQRILLVVGALVVAALCWLLLWKPVSDWREVSHNRYQNAQATLQWLQVNEQRARAVATVSAPNRGEGGNLMALVTRSAAGLGIKLNRLQPNASGGVTVVMESQNFDNLLTWLVQLRENNSVQVANVSINREEQPGLVDVQLDFNQ